MSLLLKELELLIDELGVGEAVKFVELCFRLAGTFQASTRRVHEVICL